MWTTLGFPRVYYDACVPYKIWDFIFLKHTRKQDKRSRANKWFLLLGIWSESEHRSVVSDS